MKTDPLHQSHRAFGRRGHVLAPLLVSLLALTGPLVGDAPAQSTDLRLIPSAPANTVAPGDNVTFTLVASNLGPASATGTRLVSQLSPRSTFVSATSTQGSCGHTNGVVTCDLAAINPGAQATVSIVLGAASGTNSVSSIISANEIDPVSADNSALQSAVGIITLPPYSNSETIVLPEVEAGPGSVYPSSIQVSGLTNAVFKATVTLHNLSHSWPDDLDLVLVGPQGKNVLLMSDCGQDIVVEDITLTFDDGASGFLPNADPGISGGTFKPSNYGSLDDLASPAPPRPYGSTLSVLKDTNPNGTWSLYVMDDSPDNNGYIADGWTLNLTLAEPVADLALTQSAPTDPVLIGTNLTYSITVTNNGPAASSAIVRDVLPASQAFASVTTTQGVCTNDAGTVLCDIGSLLVGQGANISIVVSVVSPATATNTVTVVGSSFDSNPSNNMASVMTSSFGISDLAVRILGTPTSNLLNQPMFYAINITNRGSSLANDVTLTNILPNGFVATAIVPTQGACSNLLGRIHCSLGPIDTGTSAVVQIVAVSTVVGVFSNIAHVATSGFELITSNNIVETPTTVVLSSDLDVIPSPVSTNLLEGQNLTSFFTVTNRGPCPASEIRFTNSFPPSLSFVSVNTTRGACAGVAGSVNCNFGEMQVGEAATVIVVSRTLMAGFLTNSGNVTSVTADPYLTNNANAVSATVSPSADLVLTVTDSPDPVWLGENLLYRLVVTNRGSLTATAINLTNRFAPGLIFVSLTNSQGSCAVTGSVASCNLDALAPGASANVNFTVRPDAIGLHTNLANVVAAEPDPILQNNAATSQTRFISSSGGFGSPSLITIPESGTGNPYPSIIFVSGLTSAVLHARVTLTNLTHSHPGNLDVLLVGPQGQSMLLMSDCGADFGVTNVTLTFDDVAPASLPDAALISSGLYRPTDFDTHSDAFAAPAPSGPYSTSLPVFRNTDPNGTWSLYVMDDADGDAGELGGWGLTLYAQDPMADLAVAQSASLNPAILGTNVVLTYAITNSGPVAATNVRLTNTPPAGLQGATFVASQGSCSRSGLTWTCSLGSLSPGETATVRVTATLAITGTLNNLVRVGAAEVDPHTANNTNTLSLTVEARPVVTVQPASVTVTNGGDAQFSVTATGTAPLHFQWQRDGVDLPGATNANLALAGLSPSDGGLYRVVVTNRVGTAISSAATLTVQHPPVILGLPDVTITVNSAIGPVTFTVGDADSPVEAVTLTGLSSDPALVPSDQIFFGGGGSDRTVTVTPLTNQFGVVTISVKATDPDGNSATRSFLLTINPAVVLAAGATYYVVSQETAGGDYWHDYDTTVTTTSVAAELSTVYSPPGGVWTLFGTAGQTFGPVDFKYASGFPSPETAYVTGKVPGTLRNDYTGFVGMRINVGANPITVTALGRMFVTGNSGTHIVKLVNAADGSDVAGGSVSLTMSGGTAGQFVYATLSSPVVPPAFVSIKQVGQTVTLDFITTAGRSYTVEQKSQLEATNWSSVQSITGTGGIVTVTNSPTTAPTRFYRVRME